MNGKVAEMAKYEIKIAECLLYMYIMKWLKKSTEFGRFYSSKDHKIIMVCARQWSHYENKPKFKL